MSQFADLLIVILLIAALISMFSGNVESTIVIAVVLVMNAVLGTVQHQKAEKFTGQSEKSVCTVCKSHPGREKERDPFEGTGSWRSCGTGSWRHGCGRWKDSG